jgi:hypothetical protein
MLFSDATFSDISRKFIDSRVFLPTTDEVENLISDHCYSNETNFIDSAYSTMSPSHCGVLVHHQLQVEQRQMNTHSDCDI